MIKFSQKSPHNSTTAMARRTPSTGKTTWSPLTVRVRGRHIASFISRRVLTTSYMGSDTVMWNDFNKHFDMRCCSMRRRRN